MIDGPDLLPGRGKQEARHQWNPKWYLTFVNPLEITSVDPNTIFLTTMRGLEQAELWTVDQRTGGYGTLLGTYRMPFEVRIWKVPQGGN